MSTRLLIIYWLRLHDTKTDFPSFWKKNESQIHELELQEDPLSFYPSCWYFQLLNSESQCNKMKWKAT